jgi:uncharacterized protein
MSTRRPSASPDQRPLDQRSPFVVDTRELGRRPGAMRPFEVDLATPSGWGLGLVQVPAGEPLHMSARLESVMDGVLVTGSATVPVTAECGRCLADVRTTVEAPVQELFAYSPEPGDDEAPRLDGDYLDLEPVLRDAVVLALPVNPLCTPDCEGLCPDCGERMDTLPDDHTHDDTDPRWAALAALTAPEES